jgi:hypothetical protein
MFANKTARKSEESQQENVLAEEDSFSALLEKLAEKGPIFSDDKENR